MECFLCGEDTEFVVKVYSEGRFMYHNCSNAVGCHARINENRKMLAKESMRAFKNNLRAEAWRRRALELGYRET